MPVQTSYTRNGKKGLPGLIGWDFGTADLTSVLVETDPLPFGYAVVQGTKARTGKVGNTNVIGFACRSILSVYAINNGYTNPSEPEAYGPTEMAAIMREGYIWAVNNGGAAVADGSQVYANATGQVVNSAAAGAVAVPGCRVEIGGAVGAAIFLRVQTAIPAPAAP